jgi:F-type H+-transporting ATPase subunit b
MASPPTTTTKTAAGATAKSGTTTSTGQDSHAKVAFPPFNPATFSSQLIWLAITFGALYAIMKRVALPRIAEVIEERRDRIQRDLEAAERLKAETDKALAGYEAALAEAKINAGGIAKQTREALASETDREKERVEAQIAAKLVDAEKRINVMKTAALAQVNEIALDTVGQVVAKLGGGDVSRDDIQRALAAPATTR